MIDALIVPSFEKLQKITKYSVCKLPSFNACKTKKKKSYQNPWAGLIYSARLSLKLLYLQILKPPLDKFFSANFIQTYNSCALFVDYSTGQQMKIISIFTNNNSVACVVASLFKEIKRIDLFKPLLF